MKIHEVITHLLQVALWRSTWTKKLHQVNTEILDMLWFWNRFRICMRSQPWVMQTVRTQFSGEILPSSNQTQVKLYRQIFPVVLRPLLNCVWNGNFQFQKLQSQLPQLCNSVFPLSGCWPVCFQVWRGGKFEVFGIPKSLDLANGNRDSNSKVSKPLI